MSPFRWNKERNKAAVMLADGYTIDETAAEVGVSSRTIKRWKSDVEFSTEVDRLSLMVGIASRAERLKIARRIIRQIIDKARPTSKDLLEWLKYAQGETDGIKLDLTALADAFASLAGSGQTRASEAEETREQE